MFLTGNSFLAIMTAAMEMLGGGAGIADQCRTTDIMADAAYVILTRYLVNECIFFLLGIQCLMFSSVKISR